MTVASARDDAPMPRVHRREVLARRASGVDAELLRRSRAFVRPSISRPSSRCSSVLSAGPRMRRRLRRAGPARRRLERARESRERAADRAAEPAGSHVAVERPLRRSGACEQLQLVAHRGLLRPRSPTARMTRAAGRSISRCGSSRIASRRVAASAARASSSAPASIAAREGDAASAASACARPRRLARQSVREPQRLVRPGLGLVSRSARDRQRPARVGRAAAHSSAYAARISQRAARRSWPGRQLRAPARRWLPQAVGVARAPRRAARATPRAGAHASAWATAAATGAARSSQLRAPRRGRRSRGRRPPSRRRPGTPAQRSPIVARQRVRLAAALQGRGRGSPSSGRTRGRRRPSALRRRRARSRGSASAGASRGCRISSIRRAGLAPDMDVGRPGDVGHGDDRRHRAAPVVERLEELERPLERASASQHHRIDRHARASCPRGWPPAAT